MAEVITSISRGMRPETARRRIEAFRKRFGEGHYYFAQHAAFPLALTADLLYHLHENFQRTSSGKKFNIPWLAIADLLLSSLCEEVDSGYELYEMDVTVRAQLLAALEANPNFGTERIAQLADFLQSYAQEQLTSSDPTLAEVAQSQKWTALSYTRPDQAAQELAATVKVLYNSNSLEQVRIASLLETLGTLAEPFAKLKGFQPLLTYAQEQAHSALGHTQAEDAPERIQQATTQVAQSLGVDLPTDREERASEEPESNTQQPNTVTPINVFISYAHKDESFLRQLETHLALLRRQGLITTWHDRQILPGIDQSSEIDIHLEQSALILLLISADFIASDYAYEIEMKRALERHEAGEARVVPILLRPAYWKGFPFAKLQMLPSNGKPISNWDDQNAAFFDVVQGLRKIMDEVSSSEPSVGDNDEHKIQELERRARINQDAADYVELGKLYERSRRIDDAIQAYEAAWNIQQKLLSTSGTLIKEEIDVLFALSRLYNDTALYDLAIEDINQLIKLQPEFADAYKQRGLAYRRRADAEYATTGDGERRTDEYKQAIADFERAVELRPDFEDALGTLGGLYRRLGDYEQAAKYYQRLYEVNPSSSYGLGNLASLSWYLGNIDDARKYFNLLEEAARVRIKEGEGEEAGQKRAQDNEAYWNYYDLALGQLATGELDAARETYAKAIEETPTIAPLDAVLSNLYFLQRAREHIEGLEEVIAMIENAKDVKAAGDA